MSSMIGEHLRISVFGESHGEAVGCVIEGLPAGETIDTEALCRFLARRAPGRSPLASGRREEDIPHFLSGFRDGKTEGTPLCVVFETKDAHSGDYSVFSDTPRPGHADYPARIRYGESVDLRGGGHFSGRLTAPLCAAGGIAMQILGRHGIRVGAHILSVGNTNDTSFPRTKISAELFDALESGFPVLCREAGEAMQQTILSAKDAGDSVGGVIECAVTGVPAGIGDPIFGGIENRIAGILFGIPALRGIFFGDEDTARGSGSENNDAYYYDEKGSIRTRTNHAGGILGGITTGMPILFTCTFKPTPSIAREQETISYRNRTSACLSVTGRHDPCVLTRAVPCVAAAAALGILDVLLSDGRL